MRLPLCLITGISTLSVLGYANNPANPNHPVNPNHSGMQHIATPTYRQAYPAIATATSDLPSIGVDGVGFNEERRNRLIAQWSLQQINGSLPQLHDPWVVDTIYQLSARMNGLARQQSLLAVPVIQDNNINAFAVPGGLIAINGGVVLASQSLDETASVIAHEIAHLSLRHYERNNDNKNKQLALQLGGLLAAIAASAASGDAAAAMMIGSQTLGAEQAAAMSRGHEREADRIGMQLLAQAGYNPYGMPKFFDTLSRHYQLNTSQNAFIPSFVQSHPFTHERLSEASARAASYPKLSVMDAQSNADLFDLLSWRIKLLSQSVQETELRQAAQNSTGAALAWATYLANHHRHDEAQIALASLKSSSKNEPLLCITKAHLAYQNQDFAKAVAILRPCQASYPERRDLAIYLADSLIRQGDTDAAEALLTPLTEQKSHDIIAWRLLRQVYEAQARHQPSSTANTLLTAKAFYARGQSQLWHGRYSDALQSFGQASELSKNDTRLQQKITHALNEVSTYQNFKPK